jgi:hypothetical protein
LLFAYGIDAMSEGGSERYNTWIEIGRKVEQLWCDSSGKEREKNWNKQTGAQRGRMRYARREKNSGVVRV